MTAATSAVPMTVAAFGLSWYRREEFARVRLIMVDRDRLPPTYDAWLRAAKQVEKSVIAGGAFAVRVLINPIRIPDLVQGAAN